MTALHRATVDYLAALHDAPRLLRWQHHMAERALYPDDTFDGRAPQALAWLADGKAESIYGPDWRAFTIGRQTVHWHIPSHGWRIWRPSDKGGPIEATHLIPLWMLVRDLDRSSAAYEIDACTKG